MDHNVKLKEIDKGFGKKPFHLVNGSLVTTLRVEFPKYDEKMTVFLARKSGINKKILGKLSQEDRIQVCREIEQLYQELVESV